MVAGLLRLQRHLVHDSVGEQVVKHVAASAVLKDQIPRQLTSETAGLSQRADILETTAVAKKLLDSPARTMEETEQRPPRSGHVVNLELLRVSGPLIED